MRQHPTWILIRQHELPRIPVHLEMPFLCIRKHKPAQGSSTFSPCKNRLPMKKLIDYAAVLTGVAFRVGLTHDPDGNALVVQMKDVSPGESPHWNGMIRTTVRERATFLEPDDILLQMRGGKYFAVHLHELPEPAVASQHFFILRCSSELLPEFLAWQLNRGPAQQYFLQNEAGSAQRSLRRTDIENLPIAVPPLEKQRIFADLAETCRREDQLLRERLELNQRLMDGLAFSLHAKYKG